VATRAETIDQIIGLLPRLQRFALTLSRNRDDADDLVQSCAERAIERLDNWRNDSRLDSWLFRMMQNLWIDQLRAGRARIATVSDGGQIDPMGDDGRRTVEARSDLSAVMRSIMALSDEHRAVIMLIMVEGFAYREAAEILEVPVGTVMSRLSRARAVLEADLRDRAETGVSA